jgi:xanthosine utilization system XapX-like protein
MRKGDGVVLGIAGVCVAGAFGLMSLPTPAPPPVQVITTPVRAVADDVQVPKWSAVDKEVLKIANKDCDSVSEDVNYENCVIGDFVLIQHKAVTLDDYTYNDDGYIIFV